MIGVMSIVNPSYIEVAPGVSVPSSVLRFRFARSSGPGGQNVNKLNTKAMLTVSLDDLAMHMSLAAVSRLRQIAHQYLIADRLVITSEESRSQIANRRSCINKLRRLIVVSLRQPRKRRPTRPTMASIRRRLTSKKRRSNLKSERRYRNGTDGW